MLDATVVIPTCVRRSGLQAVLASVQREMHEGSVILALDARVDDERERCARRMAAHWSTCDLDVRTVRAPRPGTAPARNSGAHAACTRWLVFLDDDVKPLAGWGVALSRTLESLNPPALVGGALLNEAAPAAMTTHMTRASQQSGLKWFGSKARRLGRFDHVAGGHLVIDSGTLVDMRGFSEELGIPGGRNEDVDLHRRVFAAGVPIRWQPELRAVHLYPRVFSLGDWHMQGVADARVDADLPTLLRCRQLLRVNGCRFASSPRRIYARGYSEGRRNPRLRAA